MTKVRQDAWSHEDDLLLAETVLRHIREGSTQLDAFEEVGDHLNRTGAACGFRWNAIVRKKYEQAVSLAKRQRKERKRAEDRRYEVPAQKHQEIETVARVHVPNTSLPQSEEAQPAPTAQQELVKSTVNHSENNLSLSEVIDFLKDLLHNGHTTGRMQVENEVLKQEKAALETRVTELEKQLSRLQKDHQTIQEDYQSLIGIMERARRMIVLQDQDDDVSSSFKMDKNGNLEKMAK